MKRFEIGDVAGMHIKTIAAPLLCMLYSALNVTAARGDTLEQQRQQLWADYRASLDQLAERATSAGDDRAAAMLAGWLPSEDPLRIVLFDPSLIRRPKVEGTFAAAFDELCARQAAGLFSLAERAAEEDRASLALRLATEAIREDPDHAEARRVLGFQQIEDQWLTDYEARMKRTGRTWHERFGWIRDRDVGRYESGLRPRGRQWISAEQDAAARRSLEDGWIISTEHYILTTNHSLEAGVALAGRLESLHAVWTQLFADYWLPPGEIQEVFAGRRNLRRTRPHQVWYFRTRDEYNAALRREQPRIDITLGIYFDNHRRAYFFAGPEQHPATIVHEAIHQLFQESRRTHRLVGRIDNFWIIEGIATYFESLRVHDDPAAGAYYTLGGGEAGRLPTARARVEEEGYYVPLTELVRLGKDDLQQRPDLTQIYSQLAGLTTFFMHADDGRYRGPLVDYLTAVYTGRADERTLSQATQQEYAALDEQYRLFIEALP